MRTQYSSQDPSGYRSIAEKVINYACANVPNVDAFVGKILAQDQELDEMLADMQKIVCHEVEGDVTSYNIQTRKIINNYLVALTEIIKRDESEKAFNYIIARPFTLVFAKSTLNDSLIIELLDYTQKLDNKIKPKREDSFVARMLECDKAESSKFGVLNISKFARDIKIIRNALSKKVEEVEKNLPQNSPTDQEGMPAKGGTIVQTNRQ